MKNTVTIFKNNEILIQQSFNSKSKAENFINSFKANMPVKERILSNIQIFLK